MIRVFLSAVTLVSLTLIWAGCGDETICNDGKGVGSGSKTPTLSGGPDGEDPIVAEENGGDPAKGCEGGDPLPTTLSGEPDGKLAFNAQYIRTEYILAANYQPINIISSKNELTQYYRDYYKLCYDEIYRYQNTYRYERDRDISDILENIYFPDADGRYSDEYFADNFLVIARVTEPSGSIRHKVERIDDNGDIVINRLLPPIGWAMTADMAAWFILIEINNKFKAEQYRTVLTDVIRDPSGNTSTEEYRTAFINFFADR